MKMLEPDGSPKDESSAFENFETTCPICMAEFLETEDLQIHIAQVHASEIAVKSCCAFCSAPYSDLMDYAVHIRDNHLKSLVPCPCCTKVFVDHNQLQNHEKKHILKNNIGYKCSQCVHNFDSVNGLIEHEYMDHNNNLDGVILKDCLPYLSVALKISGPIFLQSIGSDTVYICVGCQFSTPKLDQFIEHVQKDVCTVYVCDKCSHTYKSRRTIATHNCIEQMRHKFQLKKCHECNESVERRLYFVHRKTCKIIKCFRCNLVFDNMYELSSHQSNEHPLSVELTSCEFCKKSFVGQTNLKNHVNRSHKGKLHLYKYFCVYCKAIFKHPQKLFGHFFSNHREIKPYTCKICDKTFRARKMFTIHIKLDHKSIGFVEFDEKYHVYFTDKKSENPFIPKSIYKEEIEEKAGEVSENNMDLIEATDCNITETDGNLTEAEPVKTKTKLKKVKPKKEVKDKYDSPGSSDDEPLLVVKKRVQKLKRKSRKQNINKFVCNICNKNCYTFQNHTHHMSLHSKHDVKKCIKCSKVFKSKKKLNMHMAKEHSSSRLTETLRSLLEKRKSGVTSINSDVSMAEMFRRTIKKVDFEHSNDRITITQVEKGSSVQKFIENFTPEENHKAEINVAVSLTMVNRARRKPTIKMTKFKPNPKVFSSKLSMPVKFKDKFPQKASVSVKLVQQPIEEVQEETVHYDDHDYYEDHDYVDKAESIPEVAEEVLLEETEDTKPFKKAHRVVIPKIANKLDDMRIAHLLPEAPYYKIVKIKDVLSKHQLEKAEEESNPSLPQNQETIKLPDGTKLVTANPLAHLLGGTSVEKVLEPSKNRYYQAKQKNFKGMLTKALSQLNTQPPPKKKKKVGKTE